MNKIFKWYILNHTLLERKVISIHQLYTYTVGLQTPKPHLHINKIDNWQFQNESKSNKVKPKWLWVNRRQRCIRKSKECTKWHWCKEGIMRSMNEKILPNNTININQWDANKYSDIKILKVSEVKVNMF